MKLITQRCRTCVVFIVPFLMICTGAQKAARRAQKNVSFRYTTFNEAAICTASHAPVNPTSLVQVQSIVRTALDTNTTLKPIGEKFSGTDIICTDGIPVNMEAIDHMEYDNHTGLARVGAGVKMGIFMEFLHKNGRTIHGIPTYQDITIGGVIGTGAHGTGLRNPTTLSDQVVSFVVVDGLGNVRNISTSEQLRAFRAHLGLLGIVYEVTMKTVPQYKLYIQNYQMPDNILWAGKKILEKAISYDRFQLYWFPSEKRVVLSEGTRVPIETLGNCRSGFIPETSRAQTWATSNYFEGVQQAASPLGNAVVQTFVRNSLFRPVLFKTPIFTANGISICFPAIGFNHRMCSNRCNLCPWSHGNASVPAFEFSAIIPLTELQPAIQTMRNILGEQPISFPMTGIYFRFLAASDGLLTVNSARPSVAIEWVGVPRHDKFNRPSMNLPIHQALIQALLFKHQGRPHWGKNGPVFTHQSFLLQRYPNLPAFIKYMEEFDPEGIFLNDFGRRLRFGGKKSSSDSFSVHCALNDACICQKNEDCGKDTPTSSWCGSFKGYQVCQPRDPRSRILNGEKLTRNLMQLFWRL